MPVHRPSFIAALLFAVLHFAGPGKAGAETWVLGSMEGFAPFNFMQEERYQGIDVEILAEAARRAGVEVDHRPMPWRRALLEFEAGRLDGVFQLTPTPERFGKWHMVGPLRQTRTVYMTLADSPIHDITSLDQLGGLVVGVVAGFTYEEAFDADKAIAKEYSDDDFTNIRKLLLGRSDVVVGGYETLLFVAGELNARDALYILPTPLTEQARYIAFPRTDTGTRRALRLQQALSEMHSSGHTARIIRDYMNQ